MNKVRIEPKVPFDLQKICDEDIKPPKLKRETKEDYVTITPASSPINISQKQKHHKVSYSDKLKLLKNI